MSLGKIALGTFIMQWVDSIYGFNSIAFFGTGFVILLVILETTYVANESANRNILTHIEKRLERIENKLEHIEERAKELGYRKHNNSTHGDY